MVKKLMQDVVVPKRGIRSIFPLPPKQETLRKLEPKVSITELKKEAADERPVFKYPHRNGFKDFTWWKKPIFWWATGGVIIFLVSVFFLGSLFSGTNIEITPRTAKFPVNTSFLASKNGNEVVPFEITMVKGSESKSVVATGSKQVERKASGRIVVYNNYSSATQKLIANTRFQATNGKVYRISGEIKVPGMSQKNGISVPGSIEVAVYADKAGPEYNSPLTDFTIPGFEGDPRHSKFYARSKTEITGGFSGIAPVASDKDLAIARLVIEASLKGDLLREAMAQVPDGYVLYKEAVQYNFEEARDVSTNTQEVTQSENGTLTGILLKKDELSQMLSKNISSKIKDQAPFTLDSVETLTFSFKGEAPAIDANTKEISFSLGGDAPVTYTIDQVAIAKDLTGKAKKDFQTILANYPSVYKAKIISIKPFWSQYFPSSTDKISITLAK